MDALGLAGSRLQDERGARRRRDRRLRRLGSRPRQGRPAFRELYFIYLLDAYHSTGIGQKLFDAAVEKDEPLYLWVAEDNPRAHRFYTRNGFHLDGAAHTEPFLGETLTEVRFVRP